MGLPRLRHSSTNAGVLNDPGGDRSHSAAWMAALLPLLFALYVCAYLDRVNVGIAALQMNTELNFSSATSGLGAGIFFIGYASHAGLVHRHGDTRHIVS